MSQNKFTQYAGEGLSASTIVIIISSVLAALCLLVGVIVMVTGFADHYYKDLVVWGMILIGCGVTFWLTVAILKVLRGILAAIMNDGTVPAEDMPAARN